ncbi:propionyl-CoA synthetase [Aliikangiella coralliicola]|uniref:Propionyl-CoA synthetase n=2 Tax=Aliikangiella coralliicola TaxID=2592383 RepID=A0A545UDB6_9GAMM|nr:propionyl-CoA synthetase [Aliikangiella coralliicola]
MAKQNSSTGISALYQEAIRDPEKFWLEAASQVHWFKPPSYALSKPGKVESEGSEQTEKRHTADWFADGQLNACYSALDYHVEQGHGEQTAIIYESPVTGVSQKITYANLLFHVSQFAGALAAKGLTKGDRVLIYMPMIPQAVVAMLACARLGLIHSVVFGGFAANELATRIDDAEPKAVIAASCGVEVKRIIDYKALLNKALKLSQHTPEFQVIYQRPQQTAKLDQPRDIDWNDFIDKAESADCVPVKSTDPLYILYTSGTTGKPKGVIRDTGGYCVALQWSMRAIYNVVPGDVYWAASDIGWVVGHSYIVYGPLLNRNTTILYEGKPVGTPDASAFWRIIAKHRVKVLFTAPTAIRAIKKEDPAGDLVRQGDFDLTSLSALFLAGERSDPDTLHWAQTQLNVPVIDHWWQTETGWSICANCLGVEALPVVDGSPTMPVPGYELFVVDKGGQKLSKGSVGALVIKTPLPPGTFTGLWNDEKRFEESYFSSYPGYYETGDAGYIDENGYVFVMSRTDDIINVAGHRLSTGAIEQVIAGHEDIAECAVIGKSCALKGEIPLALIVLNCQTQNPLEQIQRACVQMVREKLGAVYSFKTSVPVRALPKTRSGKVLRATMKQIAQKQAYSIPATIDDPKILDEIEIALDRLN